MGAMADTEPSQSNFERLAQHLKPGSLAARLVGAHISGTAGAQEAALRTVITDRLNELRQAYAGTADQ